jgi:hypothetical protein
MLDVTKQWNPKQALLRELIQKASGFDEAIKLALELHAMVHMSEMSEPGVRTYMDELWNGLREAAFRLMPTPKDVTIAWNLWHITRIEDLTANILIAGGPQVLDDGWLEKLKTCVRDTGNAMSDDEITAFSLAVNMPALRDYRTAVGRRTRGILLGLRPEDIKRKVESAGLERIRAEGGVLDVEGSSWLLDFWGRKNIAGIILMPITRHQAVHINDSLRLKEKCKKSAESAGM